MVNPPPVLAALGLHKKCKLSPVNERHEQRQRIAIVEITERFQNHLLASNERTLETPLPRQEFRLRLIDLGLEAEGGYDLPGNVDGVRLLARVVRHLQGPNRELVVG